MKIAIMQPYIFPYIGYFQLIAAVDKFICLDDVTFIKKGWINRNQILINGEATMFTIPIKKISQNRLINQHFTVGDTDWGNKLLDSLCTAYKKSPYFGDVFPIISELILQEEQNISKFNFNCLKTITKYLKVKTEIIPSSSIYDKKKLTGQQRIIDICTIEKASHYVNLPGGKILYNKDHFAKKGIELQFINSNENIMYPQFDKYFVANLSIIDLMMFNSIDEIHSIIKNIRHE